MNLHNGPGVVSRTQGGRLVYFQLLNRHVAMHRVTPPPMPSLRVFFLDYCLNFFRSARRFGSLQKADASHLETREFTKENGVFIVSDIFELG